jgi:hypothetical protein
MKERMKAADWLASRVTINPKPQGTQLNGFLNRKRAMGNDYDAMIKQRAQEDNGLRETAEEK